MYLRSRKNVIFAKTLGCKQADIINSGGDSPGHEAPTTTNKCRDAKHLCDWVTQFICSISNSKSSFDFDWYWQGKQVGAASRSRVLLLTTSLQGHPRMNSVRTGLLNTHKICFIKISWKYCKRETEVQGHVYHCYNPYHAVEHLSSCLTSSSHDGFWKVGYCLLTELVKQSWFIHTLSISDVIRTMISPVVHMKTWFTSSQLTWGRLVWCESGPAHSCSGPEVGLWTHLYRCF